MQKQPRRGGVRGIRASALVVGLTLGAIAQADLPIIYVNQAAAPGGNGTSWAKAYQDLQLAINKADTLGAAQVWVAQGKYKPGSGSSLRTSTFELVDGIELYGGFAGGETLLDQRDFEEHKTILSGNIGLVESYADNAYHVLVFDEFFGEAVIDGLYIEDGNANGTGSNQSEGGGMHVRLANPTIVNCVFRNNSATDAGGGLQAELSSPEISYCTFADNTADSGGGVSFTDGGSIISSAFDGNSAGFGGALATCCSPTYLSRVAFKSNFGNFGGAVFVANAELTAKRCGFFDNVGASGGGIYIAGAGKKKLINCRFGDCVSMEGGAIWTSVDLELSNCQIVRSLAFQFGGGVFSSSASSKIDANNCTVAENEALFTGGGFYLGGGTADISNSILWKNQDTNGLLQSSQVRTTSLSTAKISYSNIYGWEGTGTGNFQAGPKFVDPYGEDGIPGNEDDDFTLAETSPCIDKGDGAGIPLDTSDLDGDLITAEPLPADLNMVPRVLDDPETPNGGAVVLTPVDVGALEYVPPIPSTCEADIDGDGIVGSTDLNIFLFEFGVVPPSGPPLGDIDEDGELTTLDLNILLGEFGFTCD